MAHFTRSSEGRALSLILTVSIRTAPLPAPSTHFHSHWTICHSQVFLEESQHFSFYHHLGFILKFRNLFERGKENTTQMRRASGRVHYGRQKQHQGTYASNKPASFNYLLPQGVFSFSRHRLSQGGLASL